MASMTQTIGTPPSPAEREIAQRVRERVMRERRLRLIRNTVFVGLISLVMLYVALLQRDAQALRTWNAEAKRLAGFFQAEFDLTGAPPLDFPENAADPNYRGDYREFLRSRYRLNPLYPQKLAAIRPVGVAVLNDPERMYLRPAGKIVILFDGERYSGEWMPDEEIKGRMRSLGF